MAAGAQQHHYVRKTRPLGAPPRCLEARGIWIGVAGAVAARAFVPSGGKEVTPPAELALHDGSTGDGQHEQLEAVSVRVRPVGARECEHGDAGPGCTRRA